MRYKERVKFLPAIGILCSFNGCPNRPLLLSASMNSSISKYIPSAYFMQGIVLGVGFLSLEEHNLINLFKIKLGTPNNPCRLLSVGKQLETQMTLLVV